MIDPNDPILDKSPQQKRDRLQKLRVELAQMGYSVVSTRWLEKTLDDLIAANNSREEK